MLERNENKPDVLYGADDKTIILSVPEREETLYLKSILALLALQTNTFVTPLPATPERLVLEWKVLARVLGHSPSIQELRVLNQQGKTPFGPETYIDQFGRIRNERPSFNRVQDTLNRFIGKLDILFNENTEEYKMLLPDSQVFRTKGELIATSLASISLGLPQMPVKKDELITKVYRLSDVSEITRQHNQSMNVLIWDLRRRLVEPYKWNIRTVTRETYPKPKNVGQRAAYYLEKLQGKVEDGC